MHMVFTDAVTHVPADWANDVDRLVYGIFAGAEDLDTIKGLFDLGSMASQDFNQVQIIGGTIDGVPIGLGVAAEARFTTVTLTLNPTNVNHAASKGYVDTSLATLADTLGTMAGQNSNTVDIQGGAIDGTPIGIGSRAAGSFTSLQVSDTPTDPSDVVPLAYLQGVINALPDMGTMGAQNAIDVDIIGGNINGTSIGNVIPLDAHFNALYSPFLASPQARIDLDGTITNFTNYGVFVQATGPANPHIGFQMGSTSGVVSFVSSTGTHLLTVKNNGRMVFGAATDDGTSLLQTTGTMSAGAVLIANAITLPTHATSKTYVDNAIATLGGAVTNLDAAVDGLGTMSAQDYDNILVTGGQMNGVVIGNTNPDSGSFTNVYADQVHNVLSGALIDFETSGGYAMQLSATLSTSASMKFSIMSNGVIEFGAGAGIGLRVFGSNRVAIGAAADDGTSALNINGDVHLSGQLSMNAPALSGTGTATLGANCPASSLVPTAWVQMRVNGVLGWFAFYV